MGIVRDRIRARREGAELVSLKLAGALPVHRLRVEAARRWGASIEPTATLFHGFQIRAASRLRIGSRSSIGEDAVLDARGGLTIGDDVNLSTAVSIWTGQHGWNTPDFAYETAPVVVGDRAWISTRVVVLPGVTIGEGAVIAAGAVVTGDVAPYTLVGGIPARFIAERTKDLRYRLAPSTEKPWIW